MPKLSETLSPQALATWGSASDSHLQKLQPFQKVALASCPSSRPQARPTGYIWAWEGLEGVEGWKKREISSTLWNPWTYCEVVVKLGSKLYERDMCMDVWVDAARYDGMNVCAILYPKTMSNHEMSTNNIMLRIFLFLVTPVQTFVNPHSVFLTPPAAGFSAKEPQTPWCRMCSSHFPCHRHRGMVQCYIASRAHATHHGGGDRSWSHKKVPQTAKMVGSPPSPLFPIQVVIECTIWSQNEVKRLWKGRHCQVLRDVSSKAVF